MNRKLYRLLQWAVFKLDWLPDDGDVLTLDRRVDLIFLIETIANTLNNPHRDIYEVVEQVNDLDEQDEVLEALLIEIMESM
ncbi:TPA: hypothetical protein OUD88_002889 [Enterobacter hormaechei]|nr:hypothetical protein [Enterobacter hormaechei]